MSAQLSVGLRPGLYPDVVSVVLTAVLARRRSRPVLVVGQSVVLEGTSRLGLLWALTRFRVSHALSIRALAWLARGGDPVLEDRWSREVLEAEHAAAVFALALRRVSR